MTAHGEISDVVAQPTGAAVRGPRAQPGLPKARRVLPSPPLSATRLAVPQVDGLHRPRLTARLDQLDRARLGMVVAPPGAGKTTAMAHWAQRARADVAWYRADAADSSPEAVISQLGAALGVLTPGHPPARDLQSLVTAIERHESPLVLVVDDLHLVELPHVGSLLQRLLLSGPVRFRLLVGSRRAPSFNLARTEVPSLRITEDDLRFRTSETAALFREVYERPMPAAAIGTLTRQTEGWAAGLHLFHLSTPSLGSRERRAQPPGVEVRYARDYLTSQVLVGMPAELVEFLRRTSCFEHLTAARCDHLLETCTSRRLLVETEKTGAMVRSDDGELRYRVHGVLRRHLETELLDELDAPAAKEWFRRAAVVLRMEHQYAAAVRVLVRVGDWRAVQELLARHGVKVMAEPAAWIDGVPEWVVETDPWMRLARARRHLDLGNLVEALRDAKCAVTEFDDPEGRALAKSTRDLAAPWQPAGRAQPSESWPSRLRQALTSDPLGAARSLEPATSPGERVAHAVAHALAGDLRTARRLLRRCLEGVTDERTFFAARLTDALLSEDPAARADALLGDESLPDHPWIARITEALATALQSATSADPGSTPGLLLDEIEECDVAGDPWGALLLSGIRAVALLHAGRADERPLEELVARCHGLDCATLEAWTRAGHALVAARSGMPDAAREAESAEGFARAAGVPGASALAYAALAAVSPAGGAELLALAESTADDAGLDVRPWTWLGTPEPQPQPIHHVATTVVVHEPPLVSVRCFGRFELRLRGEEPRLERVRPRARAVLRLLALESGRPVHRELLVDALWRDLDPIAGTHNLHVSVSSLRSALEPGVPRGASTIVVRDGERYQLAIPPGSFSDILEFDNAVARAEQSRAAGAPGDAVAALDRALELYTGDVLPEDGPAEWVIGAREHYRVKVAEVAGTLAELHLSLRNPSAAASAALRSLDIDPCRDASWRLLLSAYTASGDLAAAEQARRSYADVLTSLGVVSTSARAMQPPGRPKP